ncbi:DUF742 domain-containing protein [Planosporangium mesophilum]|uniref:DUF742 domain-containing protein n=1 Tax=Planosporangium mesophilum TaxID=689768 RepID=A0A8J3TLP3_9ACTN|nr:DUF742 domain-containing protein [Planosporangium mesophilum]NJC84910.1 DUF742 domain-containing protein [Planosporangium mesophilum]GII23625.1 hypothetical protein Pme01_32220 [Planosporangium mesophilum]
MDARQDPTEDRWLDEDAGPVVRPYAMTRGRTKPEIGDFDLIALVAATRPTTPVAVGLGPEHHAIVDLCQQPLSVAEISAHLDLPVGIVRVLLGDLLGRGLIVARGPRSAVQMHHERVLKAVLEGLRSL